MTVRTVSGTCWAGGFPPAISALRSCNVVLYCYVKLPLLNTPPLRQLPALIDHHHPSADTIYVTEAATVYNAIKEFWYSTL